MLVYVLNNNGNPLMPCKPSRARKLLKQNKAKVIKREPFTIQLLYGSTGYKQNINLGIDCGSEFIGLSATTETKELFSAEVELRNDIVKLLSIRKENRRTKRNRLRYRKCRFLNRVRSKHKGWLAPSIENKINTHFNIIDKIHKLLPISKIIVEAAQFDIQKIKNPNIKGKEYQEGEQLDFWNIREYVLFRDNHNCQYCKGKSKDNILNVHHIESRKTGGDSPNNLITLCETCHDRYHKGKIKLNIKRGKSFKDAAFMGIMRWTFYNRLKEIYYNVNMTYGYMTKNTRITNNLPKAHRIDAKCISENPLAKPIDNWYYIKQVRKHNRQIHKANLLKGNRRKTNQGSYEVKGYRLFDKVKYLEKECFIFGRRATGYFDLRTLKGEIIHRSASFKKIKLLTLRKSLLWERNTTII